MSLASAFSTAQETALRASTGLAALVGTGIFDTTPTNEVLPYVVFGEDQVLEDVDGCAEEGEIFATVHVWSRPEPPQSATARLIASEVIIALRADLALVGFDVDLYELQDQTYSTDPDGSTHVRLVFRYLTTEQVA